MAEGYRNGQLQHSAQGYEELRRIGESPDDLLALREGLVEKASYGKWKLSDTHSHHSHRSHFSEPAERDCEQSECESERHSTPDDLGPGDWVPDYAPDTEPPEMDPWL